MIQAVLVMSLLFFGLIIMIVSAIDTYQRDNEYNRKQQQYLEQYIPPENKTESEYSYTPPPKKYKSAIEAAVKDVGDVEDWIRLKKKTDPGPQEFPKSKSCSSQTVPAEYEDYWDYFDQNEFYNW